MFVDASHYGAATSRRRVIVIGVDGDQMPLLSESDLTSSRANQTYTVKDAISDLPEPGDGEWSEYITVSDLSAYANRARHVPDGEIGWPEYKSLARKHQVSGFLRTAHTKEVLKRLSCVKPGTSSAASFQMTGAFWSC
jgi:DNA (cytosine-5)-methyltransferase 1